jgi:hypothetical protein
MRIRYISGRNGNLNRGLSAHLRSITGDYEGLATNSALLNLPISEQIAKVHEFSLTSAGGALIAGSYGAYLLVLSWIEAAVVPERVLLLSPVLGKAIDPTRMAASRPPQERLLRMALNEQRVTKPKYLRIVTGADDKGCCPILAKSVAEKLAADYFEIVPNQGHSLNNDTVLKNLRKFLDEETLT